ncbi:MAG: hypothetical protein Q9179_001298 [Wetmoreana sp. 5 TL-2023]
MYLLWYGLGGVFISALLSSILSQVFDRIGRRVKGPALHNPPRTDPVPSIKEYSLAHLSRRHGASESTVRIALVEDDIFLVQGAKNVSKVFRTPGLSVMKGYAIALRYCFGMAKRSVKAYLADTSGSQLKPNPGSKVGDRGRISYHTHENLVKGLLEPGFISKSDRFEDILTESLSSLDIHNEWVDFPDLLDLLQGHVGSAVLKTIFGDHLLLQNPNFVRDLWEYDGVVMNLARRVPSLIIPSAYRLREKLLSSIKRWYLFAKTHSGERKIDPIDGSDPIWGSAMMRERHDMLVSLDYQDIDSVASTDLGFIWA